jgi:hypothetical protein
MSIAWICALLLLLSVVLSGLRRLFSARRMDADNRPAAGRTAALLVLSMLSASLLYFTLFPPDRQAPAGQLTVLTANAKTTGNTVDGPAIALPEAPAVSGVARAPDLATALRQHPGLQSLRLIGDGLPARDRESVYGLSLHFESADVPLGLVDFWQSPIITPGAMWSVRGRIHGAPDAGVRLIDPAGKVLAQSNVDADGHFTLSDEARGPGLYEYTLNIQDANGKPIEALSVPIAVREPIPMRILSLSGGPNAEVKTLRRWAVDAGAELESRIALGPGMAFQTGQVALSPANLRDSDWLILDERAWDGLSAAEKRTVRDAVSGGLGLLLRITGPLSTTATADFAKLGFRIRNDNLLQGIRLSEKTDKPQWPGLNRRPISVQAESAQTVVADSNNQPLALWRPVGQGRVGVVWLTDSYRLSLAGFPEEYARIWSALAKAVARAQTLDIPMPPDGLSHPDQRAVFCQLENAAQIIAPDGSKTALVIESMPGRGNCAGFWPTSSGWHYLENGAKQLPFFVHPAGQGRALDRQSMQQATRQLSALATTATVSKQIAVAGRHWPYFLAWLALTGLMWLLERSRWGFRRPRSEAA